MKTLNFFLLIILFFCLISVSCREPKIDSAAILANRKYDIEFEKQLITAGIDEDKLVNDVLKISRPDTIVELAFGNPIVRFDGIEIFKNLERLYIDNISKTFKTLDVNQNEKLKTLNVRVTIENTGSFQFPKCLLQGTLRARASAKKE